MRHNQRTAALMSDQICATTCHSLSQCHSPVIGLWLDLRTLTPQQPQIVPTAAMFAQPAASGFGDEPSVVVFHDSDVFDDLTVVAASTLKSRASSETVQKGFHAQPPRKPTIDDSRASSVFPALDKFLPRYFGKPALYNFTGNLIAGVTVALINVPLSLALAIASALHDASTGVVTAWWGGVTAALLGSSHHNIVGPTGTQGPVIHPTFGL